MKKKKGKLKFLPFPLIQIVLSVNLTFGFLEMAVTSTRGKRRLFGESGGGIKARRKENLYIGCMEVLEREFPTLYVFRERCGTGKRSKISNKVITGRE